MICCAISPAFCSNHKTKHQMFLLLLPVLPKSTRLPSSGAPLATILSALLAGPPSTPAASAACTVTARSPPAGAFPPRPSLRTARTAARSRREKALSRRLLAAVVVGTAAAAQRQRWNKGSVRPLPDTLPCHLSRWVGGVVYR